MKASAKDSTHTSAPQLLRALAPPDAIIHVGAGSGSGPLHQWQQWQVSQAWLIDADATRLQWLQQQPRAGWQAISAAVAGQPGPQPFLYASNPDESSLLPLEALQSLWPNLQRSAAEELPATTLDQLLPEEAGASPQAPWLIVDCLPALPILQGGAALLASCQVVWARVLLQDPSGQAQAATLAALEGWLQELGFVRVDLQPGNHPALAHALFARDWREESVSACHARDEHVKLLRVCQQQLEVMEKAKSSLEDAKFKQAAMLDEMKKQIAELTAVRDQQVTLAAEYERKLANLSEAYDGQIKLASERQQHLEELASAKAAIEREMGFQNNKLVEIQREVEELRIVRDKQDRAVQEKDAILEKLAGSLNDQKALTSEYMSKMEQLANLSDEQAIQIEKLSVNVGMLESSLRTKNAEVDQLRESLEELRKFLGEVLAKLSNAEQQIRERDLRQNMLNEEVTRAEAQIDLIADVLLRGEGL